MPVRQEKELKRKRSLLNLLKMSKDSISISLFLYLLNSLGSRIDKSTSPLFRKIILLLFVPFLVLFIFPLFFANSEVAVTILGLLYIFYLSILIFVFLLYVLSKVIRTIILILKMRELEVYLKDRGLTVILRWAEEDKERKKA